MSTPRNGDGNRNTPGQGAGRTHGRLDGRRRPAVGRRRVHRSRHGGPFPAQRLIRRSRRCNDYSWVAGLGVGFVLYLLLSSSERDNSAPT